MGGGEEGGRGRSTVSGLAVGAALGRALDTGPLGVPGVIRSVSSADTVPPGLPTPSARGAEAALVSHTSKECGRDQGCLLEALAALGESHLPMSRPPGSLGWAVSGGCIPEGPWVMGDVPFLKFESGPGRAAQRIRASSRYAMGFVFNPQEVTSECIKKWNGTSQSVSLPLALKLIFKKIF